MKFEIEIKSRDDIEMLAKKPFDKKTALISITDYDWTFADLDNSPDYLLQLAFDDVDADVFVDEYGRTPTEDERRRAEQKYHMFTDVLAEQIADFYNQVCDRVDVIISQCEHGQSRSAAVAAAITEFRFGNGIDIFSHDDYYPNKLVFRKVISKLRQLS